MNATVEQIIQLIDQLPAEEQETLEERLAQRAEAAWRKEAEQARKEAAARGIDQQAIDEAVRKERYGE